MKDTLWFVFALLFGWAYSTWERLLGNLEFAVIRRPLQSLAVAALLGAIITTWMLT